MKNYVGLESGERDFALRDMPIPATARLFARSLPYCYAADFRGGSRCGGFLFLLFFSSLLLSKHMAEPQFLNEYHGTDNSIC